METTYWQLKTDLFTLQRREAALKDALAQAKFDLRNAKAAQMEYNGSFRKFLDKFSGHQQDRLYALKSEYTKAEGRLNTLTREKQETEAALAETRAKLDALPEPEDDPRGEAKFCIACLQVLLPAADEALTERRTLMQGAVPGQIMTHEDRQRIYTKGDRAAEDCAQLLKPLDAVLRTLNIPFTLPACYENPTAYLANATQYTAKDRLNDLMAQTVKLSRLLPDLLRQVG